MRAREEARNPEISQKETQRSRSHALAKKTTKKNIVFHK